MRAGERERERESERESEGGGGRERHRVHLSPIRTIQVCTCILNTRV